jgi:O-antigen/teichoic acid export membrane protein
MIKRTLLSLIRDKNKRNFFIYGLGQAFNLLSPLIVAPYIVSVCKEEGLGKVGLGFALSLFLILIVDYAFDVKGTKQVAENRDNRDELEKILSTTIFTKILLFGLALLISLLLVSFVPFFSQEKTLFLFSLSIVFAQVFNPVWFLQGIEEFPIVSMINIASKVLYVVLVYMFVAHKGDYILVNLFLGTSSFIFYVSGLFIIKRKFNFGIIPPAFEEVRHILKTDFSFCVSQLFLSARQLSPLVLTGYFLGFYVAGQYKILEQILTLFRTFIQVFLKFFYPSVCYKIIKDIREGFSYWKKYTLFNIAFVCCMLCIIFVFSENILRFFHLSESSVQQLNLVFRISLLVSMMMSVSIPLEQLMFVANRNKIYIRITIFVTVINVSLILILINQMYLMGIIISLIVSEILFISLYFQNSYRYIKDKINNESSTVQA